MTPMQTISITVTGKVQGVFYRQSTKEKAIELNISGIVRNLPNGDVQIIATGDSDNLNALAEWCWQGPRKAVVTSVQFEPRALEHFEDFKIQR